MIEKRKISFDPMNYSQYAVTKRYVKKYFSIVQLLCFILQFLLNIVLRWRLVFQKFNLLKQD